MAPFATIRRQFLFGLSVRPARAVARNVGFLILRAVAQRRAVKRLRGIPDVVCEGSDCGDEKPWVRRRVVLQPLEILPYAEGKDATVENVNLLREAVEILVPVLRSNEIRICNARLRQGLVALEGHVGIAMVRRV